MVRKADHLMTFTYRFSLNLRTSTSWNPKGLYSPLKVLFYLYLLLWIVDRPVAIPLPGHTYIVEWDSKSRIWSPNSSRGKMSLVGFGLPANSRPGRISSVCISTNLFIPMVTVTWQAFAAGNTFCHVSYMSTYLDRTARSAWLPSKLWCISSWRCHPWAPFL